VPVGADNWFVEWAGTMIPIHDPRDPSPLQTSIEELLWSRNLPAGNHLWEICEDRYHVRSTILTTQLPVSRWHEQIGDPTLADGILDRLVHNAHRIDDFGILIWPSSAV